MITVDSVTTLYPKITTHISDVVDALQHLHRDLQHPEAARLEPIPILGTVKLHGTHADILVHGNDEIVFQSRNISGLSLAKDNHGFATIMSSKQKILLRLRDVYLARWTQLNPGSIRDPTYPIVIAGEWIGEKIEKGVAISQLSKRFVIVSVNINGKWQRDQEYAGISLPNHGIYNISRAGIFHATLYPADVQRTAIEVESMAEAVASKCPFAETFGIEGEGEGIVWKPVGPVHNANPTLWFKTKGGRFKPTFARPPKKTLSFDTAEENRKAVAEVAQTWSSHQRLDQGWDVLREKGQEQDLRGLAEFLKWVQQDILTEEKGYIRKYKIHKADLKIEIAKIAKPWYLAKVNEGVV